MRTTGGLECKATCGINNLRENLVKYTYLAPPKPITVQALDSLEVLLPVPSTSPHIKNEPLTLIAFGGEKRICPFIHLCVQPWECGGLVPHYCM